MGALSWRVGVGGGLALALALGACTARGTGAVRPPAGLGAKAKGAAQPAALPSAFPATRWPYPKASGERRLVDLSGGGSLSGQVLLRHFPRDRQGDSRAYRLAQAAAVPAAQALVLITLVDDAVVRVGGQALVATSDAEGRFSFAGQVPTDRALVVQARLRDGVVLSALLPPGAQELVVDEASTVVLEGLRQQLPQAPDDPPQPGERVLAEVGATELEDLAERSRPFLASLDAGALRLAFQAGAGEALRSAAVAFLGQGTGLVGGSAADGWSDAWLALLGHRPVPITRVAGTGRRLVVDDRGDEPATGVELVTPVGLASWGEGLFVAEQDGHRVTWIPAEAGPGFGAQAGQALQAGAAYSVLGPRFSTVSASEFEGQLLPVAEGGCLLDPAGSGTPLADASAFPMFAPWGLAVEDSGGGVPHLAVSSRFAKRVHLLPGAPLSRYGEALPEGQVALLVGRGLAAEVPDGPELALPGDDPLATQARYLVGDGGPAHLAALGAPAAVAFDAGHHLWIQDGGRFTQTTFEAEADPMASQEPLGGGLVDNHYHGHFRVVRASDGHIFTQALRLGAAPLRFEQPVGLALHGGHAYVADPARHWVFRFALPNPEGWATNPAPLAVTPVLGAVDEPGVLDLTQLPGGALPAFQDLWDAMPASAVRLESPRALAVGADGRLWVADAGRVWSVDAAGLDGVGGQARLVAGGLDRDVVEGDAHLAWLPKTAGLAIGASGRVFLADEEALWIRALHVGRGLE